MALLATAMLAACATDPAANPQDPYESTNRRISEFNEQVDTKLLRPVAVGYQKMSLSLYKPAWAIFLVI